MKTSLLLKISKNNYFILSVLLVACYVLFNTVLGGFGRVDYVIVIYLFFVPHIHEDNLIPYAAIFGFFYDYLIDAHIGVGVLLFIFFSVVKIVTSVFFDLKKLSVRFLFSVFVIFAFTVFNLFYFKYQIHDFMRFGFLGFIVDFAVYAVIFVLLELFGAFSVLKR